MDARMILWQGKRDQKVGLLWATGDSFHDLHLSFSQRSDFLDQLTMPNLLFLSQVKSDGTRQQRHGERLVVFTRQDGVDESLESRHSTLDCRVV